MADLPVRTNKHYGWHPSHPDTRDFRFAPHPETVANLPPQFDLRPQCPPPYDQGQLGSCTANGTAFAVQFARRVEQLTPDFTPSRLFIYYGERQIEGTVDSDSGAEIRDGFKVLSTQGAPPETDWPYEISQFATQPPPQAYEDAKLDMALQFMAVNQDLTTIKSSIYQNCPVVMGFTVYQSFESQGVANTGVMPMPQPNEKVVGGHCTVWVGWDDSKQVFITRNSWGAGWGEGGYFYFPYAYALDPNLASDFWSLQKLGS
jgi:C1A family cysteine protease